MTPDDVKIKVLYTAISKDDLRISRAGDVYSRPQIPGYEMTGIITALGTQAAEEGLYIGQTVSGTPISFCGNAISVDRINIIAVQVSA